MSSNFRLLRAGGAPPSADAASRASPHPVVTFSDPKSISGKDCFYSIIIGNNGTGKSRLLGNIAAEFIRMERSSKSRDRRARIGSLDYVIENRRVTWNGAIDLQQPLSFLEDAAPVALPSRVIAVALTPVDKFPLEPSGDGDDISSAELADLRDDISFYHYVGMRDRTNRASISALLYRALEGLGRRRSSAENARLRSVFEMLGYQPRINAKLRANLGADVHAFVEGNRDLATPSSGESRLLTRLRTLTNNGAYTEEWLRSKLSTITRTLGKQRIDLNLSFTDDMAPPPFDVDALRLLRRLGALTLAAVDVWRLDGTGHDLRDASSGEISILTVFLSVAAHLKDGSLVLIDEPETSLHPEWQSKYIPLMRDVFSTYSGCHFILSTHSPHIVADVPPGSWVYSMDRGNSLSTEEISGRSPDYLMANAFDVISPTNYYLRDVLADALRLVGDRQINSAEFAAQLSELVRLAGHMEGGDRIKQIVKDLQIAKAELAPDGN